MTRATDGKLGWPEPPRSFRLIGRGGVVAGLAVLAMIAGAVFSFTIGTDDPCVLTRGKSPGVKRFDEEPQGSLLGVGRTYSAIFETSEGRIRVRLDPRSSPRSVNNFVFLAREGFYDGTTIHRVVNDEEMGLLQGGDPTGRGTGDPGYTFEGDVPPYSSQIGTRRVYKRGTLAFANAGDIESSGSQFFIVARDWTTTQQFSSFGGVADEASIEVVDRIVQAEGDPWLDGLGLRPRPEIRVDRVLIEECETRRDA